MPIGHPCIKGKSTEFISPPVQIFFHVFFSIKTLFGLQTPLIKEKLIFYCIFELTEAFTTRLHQKNVQKPSKKAKNTAACTNILPQRQKSYYSPPLLAEICLLYTGDST